MSTGLIVNNDKLVGLSNRGSSVPGKISPVGGEDPANIPGSPCLQGIEGVRSLHGGAVDRVDLLAVLRQTVHQFIAFELDSRDGDADLLPGPPA